MSLNQELALLAEEIDQHLRTVRQIINQPLKAEFAKGELTGPQQNLMRVLVNSSGLSLKDASRQLGLAHSTVSGIVDRLEEKGLIERTVDEKDRRITLIRASRLVRDYIRDTLPMLAIHPLVEALRRAKPSERATVLDGLRTLRRLVDS